MARTSKAVNHRASIAGWAIASIAMVLFYLVARSSNAAQSKYDKGEGGTYFALATAVAALVCIVFLVRAIMRWAKRTGEPAEPPV